MQRMRGEGKSLRHIAQTPKPTFLDLGRAYPTRISLQ